MSEVWSHGMQVERTILAWTRTSLAMAAASLLLVRIGLSRDSLVIAVAAAASLVAWLLLAVISRRRYHKVSDEVKPDWDLSGAVEDIRLLIEVGLRVARGEHDPEWKPGTEFKARREAMLKKAAP